MALSFGRALLAGAAGVAEYSNKEQAKRQKMLDRTIELKNRLALDNSKSNYALRMKEYDRTQGAVRALGSTDPNSEAGQVILGQYNNPGMDANTVLATLKAGARYDKPESMETPVFEMPTLNEGERASSPIQDWINGYRGRDVSKPEGTETIDQMRERMTNQTLSQFEPVDTNTPEPQSPQRPQDLSMEEFIKQPQGMAEPIGTSSLEAEGQNVGTALDFAQFDKPAKPVEYSVDKSSGVQDGKQGNFFTRRVKGSLQDLEVRFVPNGKSALVSERPVRITNEDGSVDLIPQTIDLETGLPTRHPDLVIRVQGPDQEKLESQLVGQPDINKFMQVKSDTKPAGRFYQYYTEDEVKGFGNLDKGIIFDSEPEGFREGLAANTLRAERAMYETLTADDLDDRETMVEVNKAIKFDGLLSTLGPEALKEAIKNEDIPYEVIFGAEVNDNPQAQQIQAALEIFPGSEKYLEFSKPDLGFN